MIKISLNIRHRLKPKTAFFNRFFKTEIQFVASIKIRIFAKFSERKIQCLVFSYDLKEAKYLLIINYSFFKA